MSERSRLVESVVERGRLESSSEAEDIIRVVTTAMADRVRPEAWDVIGAAVPSGLEGEGSPSENEVPSVSALFEEVAESLQLSTVTSATYVRVVAESISELLAASDLEKLERVLEDEFLALFEIDHRGELTEDDGATPGAAMLDSPEEERKRHRRT